MRNWKQYRHCRAVVLTTMSISFAALFSCQGAGDSDSSGEEEIILGDSGGGPSKKRTVGKVTVKDVGNNLNDGIIPPKPVYSLSLSCDSVVTIPGAETALEATAMSNHPDPITYTFQQISGPAVILDISDGTASLTGPEVEEDTILSFVITASVGNLLKTVEASVKVITKFSYLGADATTGSHWENASYGQQGYWFPRGNAGPGASGAADSYPMIGEPGNDDLVSLPEGISITWGADVFHYIWTINSTNPAKAVFKPGETSGFETCLWHTSKFEVAVNQTEEHRVPRLMRVYITDHENNRELDIIIKDRASGSELHRFEARASDHNWKGSSAKGYWFTYRIYNDILVEVEAVTGNAILQGITFDNLQFANAAPEVTSSEIQAFELENINLSINALDPDGDDITYRWTQVGGLSGSLIDTDKSAATFTAPDFGEYIFEVTVSDWSGASNSANVALSISAPPAEPEFLGPDVSTGPHWVGAGYGTMGYYIPVGDMGGSSNAGAYPMIGAPNNYDLYYLPGGVNLTWGSETHAWIWANPGSPVQKSIERPEMSTIESCLWNETVLTVNISLGNVEERIIRFYITDHEDNRELDIRLKNPNTGQTYHVFEARASDPNWRNGLGYWLSYRIYSNVQIEITAVVGNAILQGIVWD